MHVTITIKVVYDGVSIDRDTIYRNIEREVERAIGDGMLSPTGDEIIDEYIVEVD